MSRDDVVASQRARMLLALADAMSDKGYAATTVADVLKGAGVSRETFYQQFRSKEACFLAAFDAATDLVWDGVLRAAAAEGTPLERFDRALAAYLDALASHPGPARLFLVETWAAGPEALRRRIAAQGRIVESVADLFGATSAADRFACEVLVAGTATLIAGPLLDGDTDALRALHDPILELVRRALAPG